MDAMVTMVIFIKLVLLPAVLGTECAASIRPLLPRVTIEDITLQPGSNASEIFDRFGVLLVRGLSAAHAPAVRAAAETAFAKSLELMSAGLLDPVQNDEHVVGWVTPDQTLFIPAPTGHVRDKQTMVLALDYHSDACMLSAATDPRVLDVLEEALGWKNIELFGKGQCFYKEPIAKATSLGGVDANMTGPESVLDTSMGESARPGGNPKYLHQDSAYFTFGKAGAVATFSYAVDTSGALDNGPLYVVPGSHRYGHLPHVDTPSHLGVPGDEWSFDDALRIDGLAGDTIFFHIHTLHGSSPNRSPHARPVFINRYIESSDYQAYFATDVRMRARAKAEYEAGLQQGRLPRKDRGIMVRGRREWQADGPEWNIDAKVNH